MKTMIEKNLTRIQAPGGKHFFETGRGLWQTPIQEGLAIFTVNSWEMSGKRRETSGSWISKGKHKLW